jgi:hypothetical protein
LGRRQERALRKGILMLKMPQRRTIIIAVAVVFLVALPCAYIWFAASIATALGPSVIVVKYYDQLSAGWREDVRADKFYVEVFPHFKGGPQSTLFIPPVATDILVAREHWVDAGCWVAFTVPKESLPYVIKEITGCDLSGFKDGMSQDKYSTPPHGPYGKDRRKAAPYWNVDGVKNGKHLEEEESDYCAVDVDACRIFLRIY